MTNKIECIECKGDFNTCGCNSPKETPLSSKERKETEAVIFPKTQAGNDMLKGIIRRAKEMGYNNCNDKWKEAVSRLKEENKKELDYLQEQYNSEENKEKNLENLQVKMQYSMAIKYLKESMKRNDKIMGEFE